MQYTETASIGVAYSTAYYSMFDAAALRPGDTVLVHVASGGVGQAYIMLARWKGINVLATNIFSSRDASFAPAVMVKTGGAGVDAVINSLAGPLLQESLQTLRHHGRFIEIGKRDIHQNRVLEMDIFRKSVGFLAVDMVALGDHCGQVMHRVLTDVMDLMTSNKISPITPIITYPISQIEQAFRTMQAGKHISKLVVVPGETDLVKTVPVRATATLKSDATYLLIGGMGSLGRSITRWAVSVGAKHLVLVSRHATTSPHAQSLKEELGALGASVLPYDCDIANMASLRAMMADCEKKMPPVRGVVHGGMVLDDSILERMTAAQWQAALGPKVAGTLNLDSLFQAPGSLDFFVVLSSFVGLAGNPSQANYGAGGAFQDAMARMRASRGLPCVTVDLGPVKSVGFVAEADKSTDLHQLMDYIVRVPVRQVRTSQVIAGISGGAIGNPTSTASWTRESRFANLSGDDDALNGSEQDGRSVATKGGSAASTLKHRLSGAQSSEDVADVVEKAIINKLSDMFVVPEDDIEASQPLSKYGVDSLVAVELRNWLVPAAQCEISIFDLLGAKSLRDLAFTIAKLRV
ncbi:KR domain-containing protein [Stachybotrys elegans]|uniref:KR domain-containing protein n=1 Tax=Stachybotrys elegans TaxID=80388 RepID=A0A8K0WQK7_9HYPO|nr:KR domain-containing protein [Stachybotrys elegans]